MRNSLLKRLIQNSTFSQVKSTSRNSSGFTLVELLIVIVIIGILAGVVIGVLNPIQQQNRARDASTRAQLDKLALNGKGLYVSSPRNTNRAPTAAEFAAGVGSIGAHNCTDNDPVADINYCLFPINGAALQANCQANGYSGSGTAQCQYAFISTGTGFRIAAHGAANPPVTFVYTYTETTTGTTAEGFYSCVDNTTPTWVYNIITMDPATTSQCAIL
ncbi:hypothetical protein A2415_01935 [candidate division WWE3 bacterium RIFOXYC1_FULL_39_7]|uniref:Type II secretion system protein GspG C-terminal domain-containing protein n=2 Tax=Katanobacteria TaxID=422282 RepID=A0A1F4X8Z6_UNCKA|nr:MAG: hypothetical protein A2415_01935 [candidate division WWE3 bacterium RIFOXYC1_FULL_39_7]OGC78138.1 MAG: hypothetical protein A2619_05305 [candidate division WWE3 bacterium RIFOXYD1_FULL_39_9]